MASSVTAEGSDGGIRRPVADAHWLRPDGAVPAEPRWGHASGLQVGLAPLRGPRGLLRIYAVYLEHDRERLINFIAVEPISAGQSQRGLSELEHSSLDHENGKRFWSADAPDDSAPKEPTEPARGVIESIEGVEHLTVYVIVEPFDNGADVYVRLRFRADRPHEIAMAAFRRSGSAELEACVLTATMGNFARLRRLHLAHRVVAAGELWSGFEGSHFTEHARFGMGELLRVDGDVVVSATPDEDAPHEAVYADDVKDHWRYMGKRAVQTWRVADPDPQLQVLLNGRTAYWASTSPIPGGVSYENFEIVEPFRQGRELTFSIAPLGEETLSSTSLGDRPAAPVN